MGVDAKDLVAELGRHRCQRAPLPFEARHLRLRSGSACPRAGLKRCEADFHGGGGASGGRGRGLARLRVGAGFGGGRGGGRGLLRKVRRFGAEERERTGMVL